MTNITHRADAAADRLARVPGPPAIAAAHRWRY
jgi:hypothetical protein